MIRSALPERIIHLVNTFPRGLNNIILLPILLAGTLSSYFFTFLVLGGTLPSYFPLLVFPVAATVVQMNLNSFLSGQSEIQEPASSKEPYSPENWVEDLDGGKGVRAAAYIRVSTDRQAQHGYSLEVQETELRELARRLGVSHLFWFVDAGKSGMDFDRRKLNAILDLAEAGEIDRFLPDRIIISLNTYCRGLNSIILFSLILFAIVGRHPVSYFLLLAFPLMAAVIQTDLYGFPSKQVEPLKRVEQNSQEYSVEDLEGGEGIKAAAYLRVSSSRQAKDGLSLEDQEIRLRELARKIGISRVYWFVDAGVSGKDFDKRKLSSILDLAEKQEIQKLLVAYVDRLGRDSRKLVEFFWDLSDYGVTIQTPEEEIDVKKLEGWLISVIKAWSAQDVNEQRGKSALASRVRSFTKKRWNKPIPLGYRRREDGWIEKEPGWEPLIKRIYELYLKHTNYQAVRDIVSREFQALLQKPLTHQQIRQIICDPAYAGRPQYAGKATVEDPNLAHVDPETFHRAQEISGRIRRKRSRKRKDALRDLLEKCGPDVLEFIPNVAILCPSCKGVMVRNGTLVTKELTAHNYLCKGCGRQRKVPTKRQMKRIQEWIQASLEGRRLKY